MKNPVLSLCTGFFVVLLAAASAPAGQVVTEDLRAWARQAVAQEKELQAEFSPNSLAVLYFRNLSGREDLAPLQKGLALMLITDLAKLPDLQVVERARLQALAEEIGLGTSGLVSPESAPRIGRLLGARVLVGGDIDRGDTAELKLAADTLEVPTESLTETPPVEGNLEQLFRLEKDLLFEIIKALQTIELTPEQEMELRKPLSTSTEALYYLFRGLDFSDQRDYGQAARHYQMALKADPRLNLAADALQELEGLGLARKETKSNRDLLESVKESTSLTDSVVPEDPTRREGTAEQSGQINVEW